MTPNKLWFKAKRYGWGWQPCSWEGWVILLLYILALVAHVYNIEYIALYTDSTIYTVLSFLTPFVINTMFLLIICYIRGEQPRWRWGGKDL